MKNTLVSYSHHKRKIVTAIFLMSILTIIICSCNSANKKQKEKTSSENSFKPNPQKVEKQEVKTLETGAQAPDFSLPDVTGKFYSLNDLKKADVLVIIFTCNHCPTAQAYEDRIIQFTDEYKEKGVTVVAIMPNSVYSLLLEECSYSDLDDTYESMIIRAKDKPFNFVYLYDGDNEAVSIKYGPTATPHAFVFDKKRKLAYSGRLDASEKPGTANAEDLRSAVDALLAGKEVDNPVNKAFGCSIKWAWKTDWKEKVDKDWMEKPVTLERIDKNGIKELLGNKSSKLRLINVWATWCGPCVIEYPELVNIHRMYYNRAFEFVSISADKPEKYDAVLNFLKNKYSAVQNYIYDNDNKYELIEAIDPEWNGALPYTLLIEPEGNIVYSKQGVVDLLELKRAIIENKLLGRYY